MPLLCDRPAELGPCRESRGLSRLVVCLLAGISITLLAGGARAADAPKKIVLIAGPITGHGKNTHEYEKSVILLKHLLDTSPNVRGLVKVETHFRGWPADEKTLDDADTIVMISDGGDQKAEDHPLYVGNRLEVLEKQMQRGCGFLQFHWTTFHPTRVQDKIIEWAGGYFDYESGTGPRKWYSAISTWSGPVTLPATTHPISRGVKPFELEEEFYYKILFRNGDKRLVPIVQTRVPNLVDTDQPVQTVGWAVERKDGGRGFSFTGGHFYRNWWLDDYRKLILNAVLWTAKVEVPPEGVASTLDEPIKALIVTGHNHPAHDWRKVTAALIPVLEQDPRMQVEVIEDPNELADEKLLRYNLVVMNYSSWDRAGLSEAAKVNFLTYLKNGGGLSIIHFANGAFTDTLPNKASDWVEYRTRIVRRVWVHGDGRSGHDAYGPFHVELTASKHPITVGLQPFDTVDELYFKQEGDLPIEPLVSAVSKVTGKNEPLAWAYNYEKSKVFQTLLGHADISVRKAAALIRRGSVWAAGREPLSFDPPAELTEHMLFRSGSPWTPDESMKRAGLTDAAPAAPAKPAGPPLVEGKFGKGLNTSSGAAFLLGQAAFRELPLTVECWAKLNGTQSYNILLGHELKSSGTHWELFTQPGSGVLNAYVPGVEPDHVRTTVNLCDQKWHHVGMVFEPARIRLYVDGKLAADQPVKARGAATVEGGLAIGSLWGREIACDGVLDEVRIRSGAHPLEGVPEKPLEVDADTQGLWHLDELKDGKFLDSSKHGRNAAREPDKTAAAGRSNPGDHFGEEAVGFRWTEADARDDRWKEMINGPFFSGTIAVTVPPSTPDAKASTQVTNKGLVVRVGDMGQAAVCYDTELLRMSAAWTGEFLHYGAFRFGLLEPQRAAGTVQFVTPHLPGWSGDGKFADPRPAKPYGSLPHDVARYRGVHRHGQHVVLNYTIGQTAVLESPWAVTVEDTTLLTRTVLIGPTAEPRHLLVGPMKTRVRLVRPVSGVSLLTPDSLLAHGNLVVQVAPSAEPRQFQLVLGGETQNAALLDQAVQQLASVPEVSLKDLTTAGPPQWTAEIVTQGTVAADDAAYVVDTLTMPFENPYKALLFASGHDFFANGDAAVCMVHGDVWRVSGIDDRLQKLTWKRIATGLFQPLGLKIVNDQVFVLGRDQITRLVDANGDGETDFYECFNNDGQMTANGHEFATCLETDSRGRFYYLRGDSGSATQQDGCLLRVSPDGEKLEVVATGFRNANGLSVSPGGTITVAPQEGNWTPGSAIFSVREGGFYGAMQSHHRAVPPTDFDKPLCWIPRLQDNSSGGQTWVTGDRWGPLNGSLLHFSFGTCRMFSVLREPAARAGEVGIAGTVQWPLQFDSGIMRGRFRPTDGQLYVTGLKGWVSSAVRDGCFQRVRYTSLPVDLPVQVATRKNGLLLKFTSPLDRETAEDPENFHIEQWNYRWAADYGSPEFKPTSPQELGRDTVEITSATLLPDARTVFLELAELKPVMQMALSYTLQSAARSKLEQTVNLTVHAVSPEIQDPATLTRHARPGLLSEEVRKRLQPGLMARTGVPFPRNGPSSTKVLRMAAFVDEAPVREVEMHIEGYLRIPLKQRIRFSVEGNGTLELKINGQAVPLSSIREEMAGGLISPPPGVALHGGFNRLEATYRGPQSGPAQWRLYWGSKSFATEPIPPTAISYELAEVAYKLRGVDFDPSADRGVLLTLSLCCFRCHQTENAAIAAETARFEAPWLNDSTKRLSRDWISAWLKSPETYRHQARMPRLFHDAEGKTEQAQQIADLAAFLGGDPQSPQESPAPPTEQIRRGLELYERLGCIACHRHTPATSEDEWHRVSLNGVRAKFRAGQLEAFLLTPHEHSPQTRMPDFSLATDEAAALAAYLRSRSDLTLPVAAKGDSARGQQLFAKLACQQCHRLDPVSALPAPELAPVEKTFLRSCMSPDRDAGDQDLDDKALELKSRMRKKPLFSLSDEQRRGIGSFLEGHSNEWKPEPGETSKRLVQWLNCTACHARDDTAARLPLIRSEDGDLGQTPEVFPNLTWAGEKLHESWMANFIAKPAKVRPWLTARMPAFPAYAKDLAKGLAAQHGINEAVFPDSNGPNDASNRKSKIENRKLGMQLVGKDQGLDCRQCHALGTQRATGDKGTLIAEGINFDLVRERLRYDYYQRFVLDPPRFDSGSRMPKLSPDGKTTPVKSVLDGNARRQFDAIWEYLQSERKN